MSGVNDVGVEVFDSVVASNLVPEISIMDSYAMDIKLIPHNEG